MKIKYALILSFGISFYSHATDMEVETLTEALPAPTLQCRQNVCTECLIKQYASEVVDEVRSRRSLKFTEKCALVHTLCRAKACSIDTENFFGISAVMRREAKKQLGLRF